MESEGEVEREEGRGGKGEGRDGIVTVFWLTLGTRSFHAVRLE